MADLEPPSCRRLLPYTNLPYTDSFLIRTDPIVTRWHPETQQLQMVAIQRKDTGSWAIPGGMVDAGEVVSQTVRREFEEEAGAFEDEAVKRSVEAMLDLEYLHYIAYLHYVTYLHYVGYARRAVRRG